MLERIFEYSMIFISNIRIFEYLCIEVLPAKLWHLTRDTGNLTCVTFKAKETYELKPVEKTLSIKVSVDEIIANLDEDSDDDEVFDHDDDNCEVLFYINEEDSDTDSEEEAYLEEVLD